MPPRNRLKERLLQRIADSELSLTVHYPPERPAVGTGTSATAPFSPLTGPATTPTLIPTGTPTPSQEPVSMPCLWLDVASQQNATLSRDQTRISLMGWVQGASAQARVSVEAAAVDPDDPWGGTVFDGCEYVEAHGRRYRVLGVEPIGPSFQAPYTYAVWLQGAAKQ